MRTTPLDQGVAVRVRRATTALASRARSERLGELTLAQVSVLGRVIVEGPTTPGEIGAQLAMSPQSLTRPLAALERRGLVSRMPDPADGRGSLIAATGAGRAAMRAEMAPRDRWVARAMAAVCTAQDRELLDRAAEVLERLAAYGGGVAPLEP